MNQRSQQSWKLNDIHIAIVPGPEWVGRFSKLPDVHGDIAKHVGKPGIVIDGPTAFYDGLLSEQGIDPVVVLRFGDNGDRIEFAPTPKPIVRDTTYPDGSVKRTEFPGVAYGANCELLDAGNDHRSFYFCAGYFGPIEEVTL